MARDYDPGSGRYMQSDPIGIAGGLNTYLYANANPIIYADPDGRNPLLRGAYVGGQQAGKRLINPAINLTLQRFGYPSLGIFIWEMTNKDAANDDSYERCPTTADPDPEDICEKIFRELTNDKNDLESDLIFIRRLGRITPQLAEFKRATIRRIEQLNESIKMYNMHACPKKIDPIKL